VEFYIWQLHGRLQAALDILQPKFIRHLDALDAQFVGAYLVRVARVIGGSRTERDVQMVDRGIEKILSIKSKLERDRRRFFAQKHQAELTQREQVKRNQSIAA
jgi:hypothetical protein